jgi:hypothetical protein
MEKFDIEVREDFEVEDCGNYIVIWPVRFYPKEEDEQRLKEADEQFAKDMWEFDKSFMKFALIVIAIIVILILIKRYALH